MRQETNDRFAPQWSIGLSGDIAGAMDGGGEGIRTPDPLLAKQVLSRLSYTPWGIPVYVGLVPSVNSQTGQCGHKKVSWMPNLTCNKMVPLIAFRANYLLLRSDQCEELQ